MKFRDLRRLLSEEFSIEWNEGKGKGSHGAFQGLTHLSKVRAVFTIPRKHQRETGKPYVSGLRRRFELTKEHGVPDDLFR
jgi:hypothetical protein